MIAAARPRWCAHAVGERRFGWMVCADSKRATTVHCPPTFGLDGLLPAAVTMHDLTEKLQQRFCCASVAQSRSIGCDVPFSREERRDAS